MRTSVCGISMASGSNVGPKATGMKKSAVSDFSVSIKSESFLIDVV